MPCNEGKLKQRISEIVNRAAQIVSYAKSRLNPDDEIQQLVYSCAELSLLALCASDDTELLHEASDYLVRTEISSRLREIAMHCLDVQEWERKELIQSHIEAVNTAAAWLRTALDLPSPDMEDGAAGIAKENGGKNETSTDPDELGFSTALVRLMEESEEDRILRLRAEIQALREILTSLIMERDHLLHDERRDLEADYMIKLGKLEAEVYSAECEMRLQQRKLEFMQAQRNRREQIRMDEINAQINATQEEFKRILEELLRKAAEAEQYRQEQEKKKAEKEYKKANRKAKAQEKQTDNNKEQESNKEAKPNGSETEEAKKSNTESEDADGPQEQTYSEDDEDRLLKKLYHKIVKAMHPDLHPNQDQSTKDLFKRAILAYKEGDLRKLQEIAAMLDGGEPEPGEHLLEALEREREHLFSLIFGIRAELREIMMQYPFNKKELLNDPVRLAAEQEKLRKRRAAAEQKAQKFRMRIEEMETEDGRADHS